METSKPKTLVFPWDITAAIMDPIWIRGPFFPTGRPAAIAKQMPIIFAKSNRMLTNSLRLIPLRNALISGIPPPIDSDYTDGDRMGSLTDCKRLEVTEASRNQDKEDTHELIREECCSPTVFSNELLDYVQVRAIGQEQETRWWGRGGAHLL